MKPGEKIRLIEEAHDLLRQRPWPRLTLVLEQFGFELYDRGPWNDQDDDEYVLRVLSRGSDDEISALSAFLRGEDAQPGHSGADQPWQDLPVRAFLSHIYQERHIVGEVKKILAANYAIDAFVAHDDIHVSAKWREVIKAGLATCDMFVAFLHDGYHRSQWCDQEAGWALARNVPIIVVRPEGVDRRDGFLEEHQDLSVDTASGGATSHIAQQIFVTAINDARTREGGFKSLVEAFVHSWSYDTTRFLWPMIARSPTIATEQLRRLEYAVETNNQVYNANLDGVMVPELVEQLVAKFEPPTVDPWATASDEPPF